MGNWEIRRITDTSGITPGTTLVAEAESLEYHGEWMADEMVSVTVKSPVPIDFHIDDFIDYRGDIYALGNDPNVVKKAARNTYGEGFTYDNIRLYSIAGKLKGYGFKDVVLDDNGLTYSMLDKFSFYAASVEDLADRLQANINRQDGSSKTPLMQCYGYFKVFTPNMSRTAQRLGNDWDNCRDAYLGWYQSQTYDGETDVNIEIDGNNCLDVLKMVYTKFGLSYFTKCDSNNRQSYYIVIGSDPIMADRGQGTQNQMIYRYGKNLGLYEIERTSPDDQEVVTSMFAYGSEKNLPLNYYANIGKEIVFTVWRKTTREYIANNPTLLIWIDAAYTDVLNKAFAPNYSATLTLSGGSSIKARVMFDVITGLDRDGDQPAAPFSPYPDVKRLAFMMHHSDPGADSFFENASGEMVITGVNINKMPEEYIYTPQGYNYPAMLSVNRLMLPGFPEVSLRSWVSQHHSELLFMYDFSNDKYDPWIRSKNAEVIGVIEGTANFDGSSQAEIFPTTEGFQVGSAEVIVDNGYLEDGADITFWMIPSGGVDIDWTDSNGDDVIISMKDGPCVAREFKLLGTATVDNTLRLTLERDKDETTGRYFPNSESDIDGDHFVVTGINMPPSVIEAAAERMLIAACGWIDRRDHVRYTYLPKVDNLYMARQDEAVKAGRGQSTYGTVSLHDTLRAGMRMRFEDAADLGIERYDTNAPFIDVLTIKEDGDGGIPTYDVVLRDEKERGMLEKLTERIDQLTGATSVVERSSRTLQYIEYEKWIAGQAYYYMSINPTADRLETSRVWHKGCLWECRRTLTAEEPWFTSSDWVCLRANNISLGFYSNTNPPVPITGLSVRPQRVDETIKPYLLIGQEDISSTVTSWKWERETYYAALDDVWKNSMHTNPEDMDPENTSPLKSNTRVLHITNADLPTGWDTDGHRVAFKCTATFPYNDDNAEIMNQITIL